MAEVWQTIEQAAVTLGLSVRTVNRHITAGKLQSRLFEGRREVLIPPPEPPTPAAADRPAARGQSTVGSGVFHSSGNGSVRVPDTTTAQVDESYMQSAGSSAADATWGASGAKADSGAAPRESSRQRVTPEVVGEQGLDMQTMLALTDSIDDKATLAVAAYQTLARSAETQVQSLRRVALGAWAAVGVMAVGVIVAVGWGTNRLTSAEVSATFLQQSVATKTMEATRREAELVAETRRLAEARDAADRERRLADRAADELRGRASEMEKQVRHYQTQAAELSAAVLRQAATRPAAAGGGGGAVAASQSADNRAVAASANVPPAVSPPVSRPVIDPHGRVPVPQSPRPTTPGGQNDSPNGPR